MPTLTLTSSQLDQLGRFKIADNFILILKGKTHIRLDQKRFSNGNLSLPIVNGGVQTGWAYQISSFHIKIDSVHQIDYEQLDDKRALKIIRDWSDYMYFAYVDSGVWQPIWGYTKFSKTAGGKQAGTEKQTLSDTDWGDTSKEAQKFVNRLSRVTGTSQGLACGPIQGENSNLFNQL